MTEGWTSWDSASLEGMSVVPWHDKSFTSGVKEFIHKQLRTARSLGATWEDPDGFGEAFLLQGARDSVEIVLQSDEAVVTFGDDKKPSCQLSISLSIGHVAMYSAGETKEGALERFSAAARHHVSLPSRAVYGCVESGRVTTLVFTGDTTHTAEINHSTGLMAYVLKSAQLPEMLRMPRELSDEGMREWLERVWQSVEAGRLVRIGSRIKRFPREMWSVCRNGTAAVVFDGPDSQRPLVAANEPYVFWHPRERHPGELELVTWPDHKNPLKAWIR